MRSNKRTISVAETNSELLRQAGWSFKDGWWCNPKLHDEGVFQPEDVNDWTLEQLFNIITATAFNAGSRWQRQDLKERVKKQVDQMAKHAKKSIDKWM